MAEARAFTPDDLALARRTVCVEATDDEFALYVRDCARYGTHPLDKMIHFTVQKGKTGRKYVPITGIDFFRSRAHDTGLCAGISDAQIAGDAGGPGFTATVTVRRLVGGVPCDFTATARWEEYYPGDAQGFMWRKMPHVMLGKCAEALAHRKAFPGELAGLYTSDEMEQAGERIKQQDTPLPERPLKPTEVKEFVLPDAPPRTTERDERLKEYGAWLRGRGITSKAEAHEMTGRLMMTNVPTDPAQMDAFELMVLMSNAQAHAKQEVAS